MSSIHPTAIIEDGVTLGAGCVIHAHAIVRKHSVLEEGVVVHPGAHRPSMPAAVAGARPAGFGYADRSAARKPRTAASNASGRSRLHR